MVRSPRVDFQCQVERMARRMLGSAVSYDGLGDVSEGDYGEGDCVWGDYVGGVVQAAVARLDGVVWPHEVVLDADGLVCDSRGHRRPEYRMLIRYGVMQAGGTFVGDHDKKSMGDNTDTFGVGLWRCLIDDDLDRVDGCLTPAGSDGALHAMGPDESLDAWTYHELVGLHALHGLVMRSGREDWYERLGQAALYHLENTQPDNATTQPWGLSAFGMFRETQCFAEQQLHDAMTQGDSWIAGLLLADAAVTLREK